MLREITIASSIAFGLPAWAAGSVSLDQVIKDSLGDSSPRAHIGRSVVVNPVRFGELGFVTAKADDVTFVCRSGDKLLTAKKPKPVVFEGVLAKAQGWDATTIWELTNCTLATAVSGTEAATKPPARGGPSTVYVAGNKQWSGDVMVNGADVKVSTASARGTCDLAGKARYSSASNALVTSGDDPQCKAQLTFTATSVKVRTDGCNSFCGGAAPDFDHEYRLKPK